MQSDSAKMSETEKERNLKPLMYSAVITTVIVEAVTVLTRLITGMSAADFNAKDPPLILQIHHMVWSIPLFLIALLFYRKRSVCQVLVGLGIGLILSDLMQHFIVLPLWVGNTGWHWP
jgi:hypothetical protein